MKTISCGIAAGLVELYENIMEESSFAKELEVLYIDFWMSGSLHLLPSRSQNTSPGAVWCFLLEHKAVVIVEVLSV